MIKLWYEFHCDAEGCKTTQRTAEIVNCFKCHLAIESPPPDWAVISFPEWTKLLCPKHLVEYLTW